MEASSECLWDVTVGFALQLLEADLLELGGGASASGTMMPSMAACTAVECCFL